MAYLGMAYSDPLHNQHIIYSEVTLKDISNIVCASLLFKKGFDMYFWLSTLEPIYDFMTVSLTVWSNA